MSEIRFEPESHSYWIGDKQLTSVTTLIKSLSPPFDRDKISKRCADREGISQQAMLDEWDRKAEVSRERGTMVHSYVEDVLNGKQDDVIDAMNVKLPEMKAFDAAWLAFQERLQAKVLRKEFVVGSERLGVAGRVDILLELQAISEGRKCLFDWKTGKFNTVNPFQKMLPPFAAHSDCELVKYSLQLSLYRLLLEEEDGEEHGDSYLVHLRGDGTFFIYRATDYREPLEKWLTERNQ